ncbi:hybrid sensor histidine kinase/response regulator [Rhodopirellula sallentina]|uniref:histidine kinase n=1 Tax=Rhodopirellula sallentina SM41 TaxID=1263870 RepID=M5U6J8_9BACT|nr:hybrid sensor histidine kinase/response regulator [Rhodopirellula sallentina]EMI53496.1 sensory box histidine kinase/response regulator [Rhodopirellula sallentina SM41]
MFERKNASKPTVNWTEKLRFRYAIAFLIAVALILANGYTSNQQRTELENFLKLAKGHEAGHSDAFMYLKTVTMARLDELQARENLILGLIVVTIFLSYVFLFEPVGRLLQHAIEQREHAMREAQEASRQKSHFLANMSHEIRTPMNGIIGMGELLSATRLQRDQRDYLNMIRQSADALLRLLNDILDFSKIEAGKLELESVSFCLRDCTESTARTLATKASEKGLELACRVSPDVPTRVIGDPGRLRQIISNLVGNAIKFTTEGEVVVVVETTEPPQSDAVPVDSEAGSELTSVGSMDTSQWLKFSVSDTGIGIPADKQALIFEEFSQADTSTTRQYGGTGLGLAICSQLVSMLNGIIGVESESGKGATFWFQIPLTVDDRSHAAVDIGRLHKLPVLIVDDNVTNRLILKGMCESWGMRVVQAASAREGFKLLKKYSQQIRLILTDCMMPEIDGFQFAKHVRKYRSAEQCTIIMLSSAIKPGDLANCEGLQIARCFPKPIVQSELLNGILATLEHRSQASQDETETSKRTQPRTILLAEDNPINQRVATDFLRKRGHHVHVVADGKQALDAVASQSFDLVLMDIHMPALDGFEATKRIRESDDEHVAALPIIAMTANAMKGDREECLRAGMNGYVSKPVVPKELYDAVETIPVRTITGAPSAQRVSVPSDASTQNVPPERKREAVVDDNRFIDWDHVQGRFSGEKSFVGELAVILRHQSIDLFAEMQKGAQSSDTKSIHLAAHTLKSSLSAFSIEPAIAIAQQIESATGDDSLDDVPQLLETLQPMLSQVRVELDQFLGS